MDNSNIPASVNQWNVEFDPYEFVEKENWLEEAAKVEDILQIEHVYGDGPVIDVGYYNGKYQGFLILANDWKNPLDSVKSESPKEVSDKVYEWLVKYDNGV